LISAMSYSN